MSYDIVTHVGSEPKPDAECDVYSIATKSSSKTKQKSKSQI